MVSTGFSIDSMTFGYVRSSFFNCIENKGKFNIPRRISTMVLLRCRNRRPIKGLVTFLMTMNFSLKVMSPTSNCTSTVAKGASNCPLATIIWNSGGWPSFNIVYGASNRILRKWASGSALDKAPVSISPSRFNSSKFIGKNSILHLFFSAMFADSGRNLLSPSGVTWSCGEIWSSLTAIRICWFCGLE